MNIKIRKLIGAVAAVQATALSLAAYAAGISIPRQDGDNHSAIANAIAEAAAGTVIELEPGEYRISDQIVIDRGVTLKGAGMDKTFLRYDKTLAKSVRGSEYGRPLTINHKDAVVRGLTVTGGYSAYGYNSYASGVLIDSEGGLIEECRICQNEHRSWYGLGALGLTSPKANARRCIINNNLAAWGHRSYGGVAVHGGHLDTCLVYSNSSTSAAGLYVDMQNRFNADDTTISNCTIVCNAATDCGAGGHRLYATPFSTSISVVNCIFCNDSGKPVCSSCVPYGPVTIDADEMDAFRGGGATEDQARAIFETQYVGCQVLVGEEGRALSDMLIQRGLGGTFSVLGQPGELGNPTPAYGSCRMFKGDVIRADAGVNVGEVVYLTPEKDVRGALKGYRVDAYDSDAGVWVEGSVVGANAYAHDQAGDESLRLTWLWDVEVLVSLTFEPADGGSVNPPSAWYKAGSDLTVVATPAAGKRFYRWSGDTEGIADVRSPEVQLKDLHKGVNLSALFVNENALDPIEGDNYMAIANAIANAEAGATVELLAGEYRISDQIVIEKDITLKGAGMDKTFLRYDKTLAKSVRGSEYGRPLTINHKDAVVRGLTVTGGYSGYGSNSYASGVLIDSEGGLIEDCRICQNEHRSYYGLGALGLTSPKANARRCVINNNLAAWGHRSHGGVAVHGGHLDNCLVYSNSSTSAAGLYVDMKDRFNAGDATISNCTFVCNTATDCGAGGHRVNAYPQGALGLDVVNCIFSDNQGHEVCASCKTAYSALVTDANELDSLRQSAFKEEEVEGMISTQYKHCCIKRSGDEPAIGTFGINADPMFVDRESLDFHLYSTRELRSPCVDVGLYGAWMKADMDLDGNPRLKKFRGARSRVDIGCYESAYFANGLMILLR